MRIIFIVGIVALVYYLSGGLKPDVWTGFAYPDKNNLSIHKETGEFESLDECRAATIRFIDSNGDYECGLNCDRSTMPMVCEKTEH